MSEFSVHGKMLVGNFRRHFEEKYGFRIRVHHGTSLADDEATLAAVRLRDHSGGRSLRLHGNMKVATAEAAVLDAIGIRVRIEGRDGELADAEATIGSLLRLPDTAPGGERIALGSDFVVAITDEGSLVAWGNGESGILDVPSPGAEVVAVSAWERHALALLADGRVIAWGDGSSRQTLVPPGMKPAVAVAASSRASFAVHEDGTVTCWGEDYECERGSRLFSVDSAEPVREVRCGNVHRFERDDEGRIRGRGSDYNGQLRVPDWAQPPLDFEASESWTCVLSMDGRIHSAGFGGKGNLDSPSGDGWVDIACGHYFGLALHRSGRVVGWGSNSDGQLEIPRFDRPVSSLLAGAGFAAAVHPDGTLTMWGDDSHGQCEPPTEARFARHASRALAANDAGRPSSPSDHRAEVAEVGSGRLVRFTARGQMHVGTFCDRFHSITGVRVRAYLGFSKRHAEPDRTLASIRSEDAVPPAAVELNGRMTVREAEEAMGVAFGFAVQLIDERGDLLDNEVTLASLPWTPQSPPEALDGIDLEMVDVLAETGARHGSASLSRAFERDERVAAVLRWTAAVDLDLHAFGVACDGTFHHVYFASRGKADATPYVSLDRDMGIGRTAGDNREEIGVHRLREYRTIVFATKIYSPDRGDNFARYDGKVDVRAGDNTIRVPLTSSEPGSWALIAAILVIQSVPVVVNLNVILPGEPTEADVWRLLLGGDPPPRQRPAATGAGTGSGSASGSERSGCALMAAAGVGIALAVPALALSGLV